MRASFPRIALCALLLLSAVAAGSRAEDPAADALTDVPTAASRLIERFRLDWDELSESRGVPFSAAWLDRREAFLREWLPRTDVTQGDGFNGDGTNALD